MDLHHDHSHWAEQFISERVRLLGALGLMIEGGVIANLEHIGATSVPGVLAQPCVDIGLAVWPFPLEPRQQAAVEALDYTAVAGFAGAPEQRFRHRSGTFQMLIVSGGSDHWTDYRILRDYLGHNALARAPYSLAKRVLAETAALEPAQYEAGMARLFRATLAMAQPWWVNEYGLAPVQAVVQELMALPCPWYIASGWALDLFLGRVTRVHQDVDVMIARADQLALQEHLTTRGWTLLTPLDGRLEP